MAITGADAKDERTGLLRWVWMIPWFAVLQAQPLRSKASELASECLDVTAGAFFGAKLAMTKKDDFLAAPPLYRWIYANPDDMQIRICVNRTKIESDENVTSSIYHRAAGKSWIAILKFYFGGHLHLQTSTSTSTINSR